MLAPPLEVQQPSRVPRLPRTMRGGALWQVKYDGWRCLAFIGASGVVLQTKSGKIRTGQFPEILPPLAELPAGTVLDGEITAVTGGVFDFLALARTPRARRSQGTRLSFVAFDILEDAGEIVVGEPLAERWGRLTALLAHTSDGLDLAGSTRSRSEALGWMEYLVPLGVEGIVGKSLGAAYAGGEGHGWVKWRVADTLDATVVGVLGPVERPAGLRVQLEEGRDVVTAPLEAARARQFVQGVLDAAGEPIRVEVRIESRGGRHERARFVRVRPPE